MLFVFERPRSSTFGMHQVPIPLDIWWFDENAVLLGMASMDPCPEEPCTDYASPGQIMWALETPSGDFDFEPGELLDSNVEND